MESEARPMRDNGPIASFALSGREFRFEGERLDEYIFNHIKKHGAFYEAALLDAIGHLPLSREKLAIDVGANLGNHTVYFSALLGKPVLALEPEATNYALLRRNLSLNGIDMVDTRQVAVGRSQGRASLTQRIVGNSGTYATIQGDDIEMASLDDLVARDQEIDLIKIDTEGDELAVLEGAEQTVRRTRPFLCVEIHDASNYREIGGLLASWGFEPIDIQGLSDNFFFVHRDVLASTPEIASVSNLRGARTRHREILGRIGGVADQVQRTAVQSEELASTVSPALTALSEQVAEGVMWGKEMNSLLGERVPSGMLHRIEESVERLTGQDAVMARLERELRRLERDLGQARSAARSAREQAAATARATERRVELWRQAYSSLAESRSVRYAHRAAEIGAKIHIGRGGRAFLAPEQRHRRIERLLKHERLEGKSVSTEVGALAHNGIRERDRIRVGIATIPERVDGLRKVVKSLTPQVDEIYVYLNGFSKVPAFLARDSKVVPVLGPDIGDRGKFAFLDGFDGYYFTADDDIDYPSFYVEHCIDGIERYGRRAVVGWHGSILKSEFKDYYNSASRQVLSFRAARGSDTFVHLLGTGCTAFHTSTMRPDAKGFLTANMADVYFALQAQRSKTPLVVLAHGKGWAKPLELKSTASISGESIARRDSVLNMRTATNALVANFKEWKVRTASPVFVRPALTLALIGRVDRNRWKKGGILKSAHLTQQMLIPMGVSTRLVDIETGDVLGLEGDSPDIVMIYPGDPERPDFERVHAIIDHHAGAGRIVIVNVSVNMRPARTKLVVAAMRDWQRKYRGLVFLMVFSDRVTSMPEFGPVTDHIVTIPKTLQIEPLRTAAFENSEGIFLGDYGKLCDEALLEEPVESWLGSIRDALPGVPLFAVDQYRPRVDKTLDIHRIPYLTGEFGARLGAMRLMISPFRYCTFEMVPMELAGLGVPVVYKTMDQSLSDYLGLGGVEVRSPADLATVLPVLYHDRRTWEKMSAAGRMRASSTDVNLMGAQMYLRLLGVVHRSAGLKDSPEASVSPQACPT